MMVLPTKRFLPMTSTSDAGRGLNMEEFSDMSKRLSERETIKRSWLFGRCHHSMAALCVFLFYNSGPWLQQASPAPALDWTQTLDTKNFIYQLDTSAFLLKHFAHLHVHAETPEYFYSHYTHKDMFVCDNVGIMSTELIDSHEKGVNCSYCLQQGWLWSSAACARALVWLWPLREASRWALCLLVSGPQVYLRTEEEEKISALLPHHLTHSNAQLWSICSGHLHRAAQRPFFLAAERADIPNGPRIR